MSLKWLADDRIDPPERRNYLKRCRQERRWRELGRELARPLRYRLYQLKQDVLGRNGVADRIRFQIGIDTESVLTPAIPDVFAGNVALPARLEGVQRLFEDVDLQLAGTYRLAGGACYQLDLERLGELADYEDHHAYQRLYWANRYAQAAALGHPRAEAGLVQDLGTWLARDWSADRRIAYPYTTSERIASLAETLFWIKRGRLSGASSLLVPIKRLIWRDALHLAGSIEYRLGPHNHILNNARALYLASMVLADLSEATEWRALAFKTWDEYFPQLILPDGSFSEATSFYLLMNGRTALEYLLASRAHGHALPLNLEDRLPRFLQLGNELLRPDGSLPRFGNSSPDHTIEDLWGFLTAAHQMGFLRDAPRHSAVTPLTVYYGGTALSSAGPRETRREVLFPEGGWAFLRRPELAVELVIHGDPRKRTYTHGDAGRGSFELWCNGTVLVREPGNVSYATSRRHWYRSGAAQNVTCLNGIAPGLSQEYQGLLPAWYCGGQDGTWQRLPGGGFAYHTRGLSRLHSSIALERRWYWDPEGRLSMEEEVTGSGWFKFTSCLHLGNAPWQQESPQGFVLRPDTSPSAIEMRFQFPRELAIQVRPSHFAPDYGVEVPGKRIEVRGYVRLPLRWSVAWEFRN
jgi:hypothetical protein